jgi:hypothetical protein
MWRSSLADRLQLPRVNADRMMLSILPEPGLDGHLVPWADRLRDRHEGGGGKPPAAILAWLDVVAPE